MRPPPSALKSEDHKQQAFRDEVIRLYEHEPDLHELPALLFESVAALTDCDLSGYTELHQASGECRALLSEQGDPGMRAAWAQAFAGRHMQGHPFWEYDPAFFGECALRESDVFSHDEFMALPVAREVWLPSRLHRLMAVVMQHDGYVVTVAGLRVAGSPPFSDGDRERLQALRPHVLRCYRQAQQRTVARLGPAQRLRLAFPALTPRQLEVCGWLAQGKSNEDIAAILGVSVETVKVHARVIYDKTGVEGRHAVSAIAHTVPPVAQLPPLWTLREAAAERPAA
ncbi:MULTISPECIES: LuxR family transcriptional regulator [unclassified Cupriavidus]|uniref:helix-turn-helix transcriptional regulator n=1 Tax=unclassified Cupriavidus TaxID=2640874 RepID=UPI0004047599|nr:MULTISPECIES: LuxR family transcriptional regulator [unclassified Cupriavidus]MBP0631543.1 LuxR family transcriptional regulator [Cupriavidus sp. AcVe19-1a]